MNLRMKVKKALKIIEKNADAVEKKANVLLNNASSEIEVASGKVKVFYKDLASTLENDSVKVKEAIKEYYKGFNIPPVYPVSDADEMVNRALTLAEHYHAGQTYGDSGKGYFCYHILGVFNLYNVLFPEATAEEKVIVILHDLLEDTDCPQDVVKELFGEDVLSALQLLWHNKDEPYFGYILEIRQSGKSKVINAKRADLLFNIRHAVTEHAPKRVRKYEEAIALLSR